MINVLHLSHTDIRYDSRILKEMTALAQSSHDYRLYGIGISMDEGNALSSQARALEIHSLEINSKNLTYLPKIVRHILTLIELVIKSSRRAIRFRPHVIHCHDTLILPLGVVLKWLTSSKLIYDAHELESNRNGLSNVLSKLTIYAEKIAWASVDLLITVSPSINHWYQSNVGPKLSELVLNSPDLYLRDVTGVADDRNYLRKKFNIPEESKIFIYVGIFGRGRGVERILEVFSGESNAHIVFMGYGELMQMILDSSHVHPNQHIHEAVQHEDVVRVIQSADVGICLIENVSLSDYYSLPNKLFECAFAGIPVLASNFPDMSNIVNSYHLGLCCDLDRESIRNAIHQFESSSSSYRIDPTKLQDLRWEAQKDRLLKAYEKVLCAR